MSKRALLRLASRFGQGQRLLSMYTEYVTNPFSLDVDSSIRSYEVPASEKKGTVLLPLTEGGNLLSAYMFGVLGHAFRTQGYEVHGVLCYDDLDLCIKKHRSPDDRATCEMCHFAGDSAFEAFGFEYVTLGDVIDSDARRDLDWQRPGSFEYRGIDIGEYASASTRKFIQKYRIDEDNADEMATYERMVESSARLVDAANELFDRTDYDAVVANQPAYLYGGIYLDVARQRDIPAVSFGQAWEDGRIVFGNARNRNTLPQYEDQTFVRTQLDRKLDSSEKAAISEQMRERRDGSRMNTDYVGGADDSLSAQDGATTVGMFTNLMWDASLETIAPVFDTPYSWIRSTIDKLGGEPDVQLVVKVHPAEAILGASRGVMDELDTQYETLPANVDLLPADTDINPYTLMEDLDAGIVWNSTIGLEMAYHGLPVVVAGDTHYRGMGFTLDPDTVAAYEAIIDDVGDLRMSDEEIVRARRYAYYLFHRKSIPFPYFETDDDSLGGQGRPVSHEEIANDQFLEFLVERVFEEEPIVLPREVAVDVPTPAQ